MEEIVGEPGTTWYHAREICLQQGKDLCFPDEICDMQAKIKAIGSKSIFGGKRNIYAPTRYQA